VGDPLSPDQTLEFYKCPKRTDHWAVAHEVGHLIGLPHVGDFRNHHSCRKAIQDDPKGGANHNSCYEGPSHADTENIMGSGDLRATWNAMPWLIRLFQHTNIGPHAWKVALRNVPPKVV
jgi:hypothetical protein